MSNPMDHWEPSGGEDWETAEDKILAESPIAQEGELWQPSPNLDPLSGPIGTWEPPVEERQWEEDMENNKMSVGEKVKHWQHFGVLGSAPSDKSSSKCTSPTAVVSSPPVPGASSLEKGGIDREVEASNLVENIILKDSKNGNAGIEQAVNREETVRAKEEKTKAKKKLEPLVIPTRDSNPMDSTSPLSAGSLQTPTDLQVDWSVSPVDPPLRTVQEESNVYQFHPM